MGALLPTLFGIVKLMGDFGLKLLKRARFGLTVGFSLPSSYIVIAYFPDKFLVDWSVLWLEVNYLRVALGDAD